MITQEEYLKAKAIVTQYERDEYEEKQRQADEDLNFDDDEDEDDILERQENERFERALNCTCGAWVTNGSRVAHVADCICGAE